MTDPQKPTDWSSDPLSRPPQLSYQDLWLGDDADAQTDPVRQDLEPHRLPGPNWPGVIRGLAVAAIAGGISLATYSSATNAGGTYIIFWGVVLWGLWRAYKGLEGH